MLTERLAEIIAADGMPEGLEADARGEFADDLDKDLRAALVEEEQISMRIEDLGGVVDRRPEAVEHYPEIILGWAEPEAS